MPERNIRMNDFIVFLWNLVFLLIVLSADISLVLGDLYFESGGLKLIFQNLKWPKEISSLFLLFGLSPGYLSPPVVLGFVITVLTIASSFLFVKYAIEILFSFQRLMRLRQNHEDAEYDERNSIIRTTLLTTVIGIIMFGFISPRWTIPIAQIFLANKFWPNDFTSQVQGDKIGFTKAVIPDINPLLVKHQGEFFCELVSNLPYAFLVSHILAAILTELFLLHVLNIIGKFEQRHSDVVGEIRSFIISPFKRNVGTSVSEVSGDIQASTGQNTMPIETTQEAVNAEGCNNSNEPAEEDIRPENRLMRVIGGSEMISPAEAERMPELYHVKKNTDSETGETAYTVYTRDFYDQKGGRA